MPEYVIVSMMFDWVRRNTAIGGIMISTAAAAASPARAMPEEDTCRKIRTNLRCIFHLSICNKWPYDAIVYVCSL